MRDKVCMEQVISWSCCIPLLQRVLQLISSQFLGVSQKSPPQPTKLQALLFAMSTPEAGRSRQAPQQQSLQPAGARAVTDLWGGLCQAHQSLSLRGASDSGQLQAVGLQLGDGGEEGGCRQGGSGEVRGSAALLLVPTEVEGHLLSYRRRSGAPLVLHRCGASKRSEGVTSGIRTGCPALLDRASLPPCNFLRPALCPPAREVTGEKYPGAAAGREGH